MQDLTLNNLKPVIGFEVHIELNTTSKMFCRCSADYFGHKPNTHICPVCLGLPGALPVANKKAIEWTIMAGLALNCQISSFSKFDRKNYFYPDLPKGYQISQYDLPLCKNGYLVFLNQKASASLKRRNFKRIRIRRVHLEEDTAKLTHATINGKRYTLIDFNRSGVPLMEIVTEPDLHSAAEAKEFLKKLQQIARWLGISDADMEKGQMRCEPTVNLEIKKDGKVFYTPLVELKNINSFRFVEKAINYEIERQLQEFQKTGEVKQPGNKTTRGWDEKKQQTVLQREKEEAADYRYFPEPDLPPMRWDKFTIYNLQFTIPELPDKKIERFIRQYGLSEYSAKILTETPQKGDYFEEAVKANEKLKMKKIDSFGMEKFTEVKTIANWIINKRVDIEKVAPEEFVVRLIKKKARPTIGKKQLQKVVEEVLGKNPKAVEDYRKGKVAAVEFLVGEVMRETGGRADPTQIRKMLKKKLLK